MNTPLTVLTTAALALGVAAGPAAAKAKHVRYKGKTRSGNTIAFTRTGNHVGTVTSGVPVTCLSINRVGQSNSGVDPWILHGTFRLNHTTVIKGLMMTALYYSPVTITAKTTLKLHKHGVITGKLDEVFAYAIPTYPIPETIDFACHGVTTFTAKPTR